MVAIAVTLNIFPIFASVLISHFNSVAQASQTNDSKYYIYANRKGCETIKSQQGICPESKLNPVYAANYDNSIERTQRIIKNIEDWNKNHRECIIAFKKSFCSRIAPKCFEDGSNDFGDGRDQCWKANRTCRYKYFYDFEGFCLGIPKGKQPLAECIFPSKSINGSCPKPKYKVGNIIVLS